MQMASKKERVWISAPRVVASSDKSLGGSAVQSDQAIYPGLHKWSEVAQ